MLSETKRSVRGRESERSSLPQMRMYRIHALLVLECTGNLCLSGLSYHASA